MLSYEEIYDRWERSKSFGDPRDLNQFSREMNEVTGTRDFDIGANAGWWTKFSHTADREVFHPLAKGLGLEAAGQAVGGMFGEKGRQIGGEIGLGLPRMVAQTLPIAAAELATGGGATPFLLGAAATGGLFGAETYANTQSPTAAAISGVTAGALPYAGKFGGELGLKVFGPEVEKVITQVGQKYVPRTLPVREGLGPALQYKAAQIGGSQVGMLGALEASQYAQAKATGQPFDPLSPEMIAQQIPFTLLDIGRASMTKLPTAGQAKIPPVMPRTQRPYTPPPGEPAETANLGEMLDRVTGIAKDQTLTPEQKSQAFTDTLKTAITPDQPAKPKPQDQVILIGHGKVNDNGSMKMLVQQQKYFDELPEHSNVWINNPQTARMMTNPDGSLTIITARKNLSGNVQYPLGPGDFAALRQKGQVGLTKAAPVTGAVVSPEQDVLSLRQKFSEITGGNQTMLNALIKTEPKDPDLAVQHWQQAVDRVTPEHMKPGYVSPFDSGEQQVMRENNVAPETVPPVTAEPPVVEPPSVGDQVNFMVGNRSVTGTLDRELSDGTLEVKTSEGMTHQVDPTDLVAPRPEPGPIEQIKAATQKIETGQMDLEDTRRKIETPPTTVDHISDSLFGQTVDPAHQEQVKTRLEAAHKEGATQPQATEKVKLQEQTPKVDQTKQVINVAKDDIKRVAAGGSGKANFARDASGRVIKVDTPEAATAALELYKTQHPEDEMPYRVVKNRGRYQLRAYPQEVPMDISRKVEAEAVEAAEPETAITGRGIYVPEADVAAQAEEGVLVDPTEGSVPVAEPEARPDLSFHDYLNQLDLASNNPTRVAKVGGFDDVPDAIQAMRQFRVALEGPLRAGKPDLKSVNAALKERGLLQFDDEASMHETFKMVRDGLDDFQLRYRSKYLDSDIPHDPDVAAATGIQAQNGLARFLEWYADSHAGTIEGELAAAVRRYSDFSHVDLEISPEGNFYSNSRITRGRPKINIQRLPTSMDDAVGDWGNRVMEEILHDTTDGLHYRTDPAAMQFKASLTRIMRVVRDDTKIPEKVRFLLKQSLNEDWYGKWAAGTMRAPVPAPLMRVIGQKGMLLRNEQVNRVVEDFSKGQKVTDAFGGSGQLAQYAKGSGATHVTMNVRDPQMRAVFDDIRKNPDSFADRVEKAVQPIQAPRDAPPSMKDGSDLVAYLDRVQMQDANVGLFLKQNLNARGREVVAEGFKPALSITETGLKDLPNRIRAFPEQVDKVVSDDGWNIVRKAGEGDRVTVDPSYVGRDRYGEGTVTPEQRLAEYEQNLYPAAQRGAKFVVFDAAHPDLVRSLEDNGFTVREVQRPQATQPELIATNHEERPVRAAEPAPGEKFDIYDKYKAAGGTDYWWPVFYALQNEHELTAGIHGSPTFRDLLIRTPMPNTPRTVLHFFANIWAKAFGYSQRVENAFAQFLQSYDTYLAGPRMPKGYNGMNFIRDAAIVNGTTPRQMASRIEGIDKLYGTGNLGASIDAFEREMKDGVLPSTTVAGPINQSLKQALMTGDAKDVKAVAETLLADAVPQHQELWLRLKDDLQIAKTLRDEAKKGNVPAELTLWQEALNSQGAKLNALKTELDRHGAAIARWNTMDSLTNSDGMQRLWSATLKGEKVPNPSEQTGNEDMARQALNLEPKGNEYIAAERRRLAATGEKPLGMIERAAKFASFTSRELPAFRPVYQSTLETQANAFRRMQEMEVVRNSDPGTKGLNKAVIKANKRVAETPGLNQIVSDMLRRAQILEKMKQPVTLGDDEMQTALRRASDAKRRDGRSDRDDVITAFNSEGNRAQYRVDRVVPEHLDMSNRALTAIGIIGREIGMPSSKANELADQLHNALRQLRDPAQQVQGAEGLKYVASQMQPSTFMKVMEQTNGFINDSERHIKMLQNFRYYVSEQRYGKFNLVMSREGEPYREGFATEKAARARADELKADGWILEDIVPKEAANVGGYLRAEDPLLASQRELDQQTLNRLESLISDLPPDRQELLRPMVQRAAEYEASAAAFSPVPTQASPRRKFRPGRETIDMMANAAEETKRFVNWMRNRETRIMTTVHMLDPEMLANRGLKQYATDFVTNQLAPDNPIARRINEATFYWYLAANFGNDLLESMQSLTTGMASLISETGSYSDALKYIAGASGKAFRRYTTGKWGNKESEWFINWLTARGHLGLPTWGDLQDPSTQSYFTVNGPKSDVGKALNAVKEGLRGYKSLFLRHNDMVGGLAGFQLGRDLGMSLEDAARFGEGVKIRGLYTGGKVQRPVGLYSIREKAVPQLMGSLKTYVLGWFSQLAHNYKIGFANAPGDFTPAQRVGAKKAFMYMLGAQATLAGALGLPGIGQALSLMKQTTGLDLKAWTRKNLAAMFGEDQDDYGGFLTGMALHGLLSQASPFDISGRQITDVPFTGVSSWSGFNIQNVAPVPFSMASDFIQGLGALAKGEDPAKAFPIALRGPVSLIHGGGDIRNSKGDLLYNLSPTERFFKTLGLEPSRVAAAKETAATIKSMNDAAEVRKSSAVDSVADLYRRGDLTGAQRRLADIQRENPSYDMGSFVRSVAATVERRTFPYDWKREVNPALDIVGLSNDQPSRELERQQLRQQVASSLGLFERPNLRRNIRAASIDDLMNSDPYMTRASALQRLLTARQLRRRNTFSLPEEYQ